MKKLVSITSIILILSLLLVSVSGCGLTFEDDSAYYQCIGGVVLVGYEPSELGDYRINAGDGLLTAYFTIKMTGVEEECRGTLNVENGADVTIKCSSSLDENKNYIDWQQSDTSENGGRLVFRHDTDDVKQNGMRFVVTFKAAGASDAITISLNIGGESVYLEHNVIWFLSDDDLRLYEPFDYKLSDSDEIIDRANRLIEELAAKTLEGADAFETERINAELDNAYDELSFERAIAEVLYHSDESNETAKSDFKKLDNALTDIKRDWDKVLNGKESADRLAELRKDNTELELRFDALYDPAYSNEVLSLYEQFVKNNNEIAELEGYDNYMEYAYAETYGREYIPDDVDDIYDFAKKYVKPVYLTVLDGLRNEYRKCLYNYPAALDEWTALDGNAYYTLNKDYLGAYIATYPDDIAEQMISMFKDGVAYFADSDDCYQGAFVNFDDNWVTPLAYFGSDYSSVFSVAHENGHFLNAKLKGVDCESYDFWETHSQGNEMLLLAFLKTQIDQHVYSLLRYGQLFGMLSTILHAAAVDKFEQYVYTHNVDKSKYDALFQTYCDELGLDSGEYSYWRYVVIGSPAYYISYATSAVVALELLNVAESDKGYDTAVQMFLKLFSSDKTTFIEIVDAAGLLDPFDESAYLFFADLLK